MGRSNGVKEYLKKNNFVNIKMLKELENIRLAIDVSGMIHRSKIHSSNIKWWFQIINLMNKFSNYKIKPVFVFDGKPPTEKIEVIEKRNTKKDKIIKKINDTMNNNDDTLSDSDNLIKISNLSKQLHIITLNDIEICKQICIYFGIPFIHIKSLEADDIFSYLIEEGIVDGVYSEDNDMFRRGCKYVYFGLDYNLDKLYEFNHNECLHNMNITREQFNNAYDSAGTDYGTDNLEYCKFKDTIDLIRNYITIENVILNLDKINYGKTARIIKVPRQFDYLKVRQIFDRELSCKIIKQITDCVYNFQYITDNVKINLKEYSERLFTEISNICDVDTKEYNKYIKQSKDYYRNVYGIQI